jgi:diazepam-binding inhibitor (GABA receptor modulator, acyl-CoA-binding protein)
MCCPAVAKNDWRELYVRLAIVAGNAYFRSNQKTGYHMNIQEQFDQAVSRSKTLAEKPGNDVLLQLYALYKQYTEGDVNVDPPANTFDFVGKAKYNAWEAIKGKAKEAAMQEYVELVGKLK